MGMSSRTSWLWITVPVAAIACRLFLRGDGFTFYLRNSTRYLGMNIVVFWALITVLLIWMLVYVIQRSRT